MRLAGATFDLSDLAARHILDQRGEDGKGAHYALHRETGRMGHERATNAPDAANAGHANIADEVRSAVTAATDEETEQDGQP